jgi:hypothetical protein
MLFVIPGRAQHEPGIQRHRNVWIPGSRFARPGMTAREKGYCRNG